MDNRACLMKVIENIFNNWTALQLAVEHSMGGSTSRQIALEFLQHMVDYCGNTPDLEKEDIEDYLEDVMDQEFNTVCKDNSISEIACVVYKFIAILKDGNRSAYEQEFNSLPASKHWLSSLPSAAAENVPVQPQCHNTSLEAICVSDMTEEDPGWTEVKSTRRRK